MKIEYSYSEEFETLMSSIRKEHEVDLMELDGIGKQLDVNEFSRKFFSKGGIKTTADISVDSNANIEDVTILQYNSELTKPANRLNSYFLLWKYGRELFSTEVANKMIRAQLKKEIYINDFHAFQNCYCFNFSCMDVVHVGLPFTKKAVSKPAKHLSTFMRQMINFVTYTGNNVAGAVGMADLLICMSWYVEKLYKENTDVPKAFLDKLVNQEIQSFIYDVNQPFRGGIQSFFTNLTVFDDTFLTKLCGEYSFPNGDKPNKEIVKQLQIIYMDTMNSVLHESPATFPITTAAFAINDKGEILDKEFLKLVSRKNLEYGFINIYAGKTSTLSSCCRLRSDISDNSYFNSFGSGSSKVGSIGVVTINLPRLAYLSKNVEDFFERVQTHTELASRINHVKRFIVRKRIESGHYPLYSGFMDLKHQYSTCGLVGINEACEILKLDILTKEGQALVTDMLDIINKVNSIQEKKYKYPHNCEQVPAENSAIKLAEADRLLGYNKSYQIYSNQFIPLISKADIYDRIKLQGMFDKHMSGGSIAHLNIVDRIKDPQYMERLIEHAVSQGVIYFAVNYNLQKCEQGHLTVGKNEKCVICGTKIVENFTRIVGFLTNTRNWAITRREKDYPLRIWTESKELK